MTKLVLALCLVLASLVASHGAALAMSGGTCALHMATHRPADGHAHHAPATKTAPDCCLFVCQAVTLPGEAAAILASPARPGEPLVSERAPFAGIEPAIPPPRA